MKPLFALILCAAFCTTACATIPEQYAWETKNCDGATTGFTFSFTIQAAADLEVLLVNTTTTPYTVTTLATPTHYSLSVANGRYPAVGGTVTTVATYSSSYDLVITTDIALTETGTLTSGQWNPLAVQRMIYKSRLIDNELNRHIQQSVRNPEAMGVSPTTVLPEYGEAGYVYRSAEGNFSLSSGTGGAGLTASNYWEAILGEGDLANTLSALGLSATLQALLQDASAAEARATLSAQKQAFIDVTEAPYNATMDGVTDDTAALTAAEAVADDSGGILLIPTGTLRTTTSLTISSNVDLMFAAGGKISVANGETLTVTGGIRDTMQQIFTLNGSGVVSFAGNTKIKEFYPQWYGATGDGVTDDGPAIQAMIDAGCRDIFLPYSSGGYAIGSTITIPSSWVGRIIAGGDGGSSKCKLLWTGSDPNVLEIHASNFLIENLQIDGAGADCNLVHITETSGADMTAGKNSRFRNCLFYDTAGTSVKLGNYSRTTLDADIAHLAFEDCDFVGAKYGVWLDSRQALDISFVGACKFAKETSSIYPTNWIRMVRGGNIAMQGAYFSSVPTGNASYCIYVKDGWINLNACTSEYGLQASGGGGFVHFDTPAVTDALSNHPHYITNCRISSNGVTGSGAVILCSSANTQLVLEGNGFVGKASGTDRYLSNAANAKVDSRANLFKYGVPGLDYSRTTSQKDIYYDGATYTELPQKNGSYLSISSTPYALPHWASYVEVDSTGAQRVLNLPSCTDKLGGVATRTVTIKKIVAGNTVVITPNGTDTIEGYATLTLTNGGDSVTLVSNGFNKWRVVGGNTSNVGMVTSNGTTSGGFLDFREDRDNGTNRIRVQGPASTGDATITLPDDTEVGQTGFLLNTAGTLTTETLTSLGVGGANTIFPADPGADRYLMWDDVPGELVWGSPAGSGDFLADGSVPMTAPLFINEVAAASADQAGKGQLWVKNTTPNELWFTDDAGTDFQLGTSGAGDITAVWGDDTGDVSALTAAAGDTLDATNADSTVPWKVNATAAPTVEGQAIWESDADRLRIGDGAATLTVAMTADKLSAFAATSSAELYGVLSDETGSASGSPLAVFNVNPTLTGATLAGILADNDDMVFEVDADNNGSNKYSFTDGASGEIASITEAGILYLASSIELGHATDTTIARSGAGAITVEGAAVLLSGGALGTPSSGTLTNCTFPTLNQSTTGSAATLTTARAINGENFDGSAAITVPVNNANDATTDAEVFPLWTATQGGNYAAKTSLGFTYHPSTGVLTATGFAGALTGNATTATTASAGDAAADFFGAGTNAVTDGTACTDIEGVGLVIDTGTLKVVTTEIGTTTWGSGAGIVWTFDASGGTDSTMTFGDALVTFSHGVTVSGTTTLGTVAGAIDAGGATSLEIPNGTNPTVDAAGEIAQDTDGANETGDVSIRAYDGTNTFMVARKLKTFSRTVVKPQDFADATRDCCPIWTNNTGMTFTITEIRAWSDTDNTTLNVEVVTATNFSSPTLVDALEVATDGTSVFTDTQTTISDATIAHDEIVTLDFDDTDDPGWVVVEITGWFNAAVD